MAQLSKEDRAAAGHVGNFQSKVGALEALRAAVLDLREEQAGGNIALRIPETDDLLVILRVNPIEARELEAMLASAASVPVANNPPDAAHRVVALAHCGKGWPPRPPGICSPLA
jgi:hypothetical protein